MNKLIIIGKIGSTYGLKGKLKLYDFTKIGLNRINKNSWKIKQNQEWKQISPFYLKKYQKNWLIKISGYDYPEIAKNLVNSYIGIKNHINHFPDLPYNEFYYIDLKGLEVISIKGEKYGKILYIIETKANDVLFVQNNKKKRLIPYISNVIISVNLKKKKILVDWPSNF